VLTRDKKWCVRSVILLLSPKFIGMHWKLTSFFCQSVHLFARHVVVLCISYAFVPCPYDVFEMTIAWYSMGKCRYISILTNQPYADEDGIWSADQAAYFCTHCFSQRYVGDCWPFISTINIMKLELLDGLYIPNPAYWGFDGGESADWRGGRCRPV